MRAIAIFFLLPVGLACAAEPLCKDNASVSLGDRVILNNAYHRGGDETANQCISQNGWSWRWDEPSVETNAYPSIVYGYKPFEHASTTTVLPMRVADLKKLSLTFNVAVSATGTYNTEIDLWITGSLPPSTANITNEVVIWPANHGMTPYGTYQHDVTIDDRVYQLWSGTVETRHYIAFVAAQPMDQATLELDKFLTDIPPTQYLADVELGNLIIRGDGGTSIGEFSVK